MSSNQFPIKIENNDGITITIMVNNNMEIKEVKELYRQQLSEPGNNGIMNMELFFKGKELMNDQTILDCKIKPNNKLSLLDMSDNIEAGLITFNFRQQFNNVFTKYNILIIRI